MKAHENFNDPEWDGEPLEPELPREPRLKPEEQETEGDRIDHPGDGADAGEDDAPREKIVITLSDGKARAIAYLASTSYWSTDGRPISAAQFLQRLFGDLAKIVPDEDTLRKVWSDPDNRENFLGQLLDRGYDQDLLDDMRRLIDAPDSDLFDVLSYILFTHPPKSRAARVETVKTARMDGFHGEMRELVVNILNAYAKGGESELATQKLGRYLTARYGSIGEGKAKLGDLNFIKDAYKTMQARLYAT